MPPLRSFYSHYRLLRQLLSGHRHTPRRRRTLEQRLRALPLRGAPLQASVDIRWNQHLIPHIEAGSEPDLAVALGVVHAHLRLTQIDFLRQLAYGRLSEWLGAAALPLDRSLRVLDITRAVPQIEADLPPATRRWLQGFADGINHVVADIQARPGKRPEEFAILDLMPHAWTLADVLAISRLTSADYTWKVWTRLLPLRQGRDWHDIWQRLMLLGGGPPIAGHSPGESVLGLVGSQLGRPGGSNAVAVDARRGGGSAKLACDPHLPAMLPGFWLLAGLRCPSLQAVGAMIPGVPALMFGRNPDVAWGGTSLHASSSDLFDVSDLPASAIRSREETLQVRWEDRPRRLRIDETDLGPVLSDLPGLQHRRDHRRHALRWVGHQPSDEITALLELARAGSLTDCRVALQDFAVPGLNLICADRRGQIGQFTAARLPRRPNQAPPDLVRPAADQIQWTQWVGSTELPWQIDPPSGRLASANNAPDQPPEVLISLFWAPEGRVQRLRRLLDLPGTVSVQRLRQLQRDVACPAALPLRDHLVGLLPAGPERQLLANWDGHYGRASQGALLFELLLHQLARRLHDRRCRRVLLATGDPLPQLAADLPRRPRRELQRALARAWPQAIKRHTRLRDWGGAHRLRLRHPLAALPGIGRRWRYLDVPIAGSNETVMKTAHGLAGDRHAVGMASVARHISDLGDPDSNGFCLLGGQDGHPGSDCFMDQWPLWEQHTLINLPLRPETVAADFPHCTRLTPATPGPGRRQGPGRSNW